jgi:hypothetical protein
MKLFKIIASQGGRVVFDDRLEAACPREARNQMRALLGMRSLTGIVYSITEIPVELIGEIAEAKVTEALRRFEDGSTPPSVEAAIRVAAAEEVRKQLGELRAEALAAPRSEPQSNGNHERFDPFSDGDGSQLSDEEIERVRSHAQRQLTEIRDQMRSGSPPSEDVVERVQTNAEQRRRRQPRPKRKRGRPSVTVDGRVIDWKAVKKLYRRNRSLKQTAAAFDLSVNTVKARARKEGWARS